MSGLCSQSGVYLQIDQCSLSRLCLLAVRTVRVISAGKTVCASRAISAVRAVCAFWVISAGRAVCASRVMSTVRAISKVKPVCAVRRVWEGGREGLPFPLCGHDCRPLVPLESSRQILGN